MFEATWWWNIEIWKKLLGQDLSKIDVLYFHNLQLSRNISDFLLVVKMTHYKSILKKSDQNCHEMWGHQGWLRLSLQTRTAAKLTPNTNSSLLHLLEICNTLKSSIYLYPVLCKSDRYSGFNTKIQITTYLRNSNITCNNLTYKWSTNLNWVFTVIKIRETKRNIYKKDIYTAK